MATPALKMEPAQSVRSGLFGSAEKRRVIVSLLLTLVTLALYNPVTRMGFVNFDDIAYVTGNREVQSGITWRTVRWSFVSIEAANWHPLTWLSHALDCQLFHLNAAGHHYDSVLLHVLCSVLLFLFLESATGRVGPSSAVAALFAVHPINVESVAWIAERKNVLCTLFFFLGLYLYNWYVCHPKLKRYLIIVFTFALALMAKPMAITFPCVLLLLDYWPLRRMHLWTTGENGDEHADRARSLTWLLLEKIPFLLLSAGSAIVTVIAQKSGGALRAEYGLLLRVENALVSYLHYLGKALWPSKLAALYPFPRNGVATWEVAAAVLAIIAVTYATLFLTQKRYFAVGWFWFLGTLVPVIGLVQVGEQAMADRYAYIPFVGLFIAVVWGLEEWASVHKVPPSILGVAVTIWIFALTMTAHAQMKYWASTTELWSHTLEVTGPNFVAEDNLGAELIKDGKIEAARARFQRAIDINSRDPFSHLDAGVCDQRLGNFQGAIAHYQAALQLSSERLLRATALSNLGSSYRKLGNYDPARRNFVAALQIDPQNVISLIGLGLVAQKTGDLATASIYYSQATHAQPWGITYILLAQALEKSGRRADAKAAMDRAKQSSPDLESDQEYADRLLRE